MSSIYPLVKRIKALRQLVLAASVGSVLLPAWISSGGKLEWREDIILIGLFTMFWIIYIDILHKAMLPDQQITSFLDLGCWCLDSE
ncbi:hypothetical protein ACEPPN_017652 [Leptodophora sp. 'Broadleaf-Isolate-01']